MYFAQSPADDCRNHQRLGVPSPNKKIGKTHPKRDQLEFQVLIRKHFIRIAPATFPENGVQNAHLGIIWNYRITFSINHLTNCSLEFPKHTCTKCPNRDQLEFPSYFRKTKYYSGRLHFPKPVYETPNIGHRNRMEFPNATFNEYSFKLHFIIPESTYTKHPKSGSTGISRSSSANLI